MGLGCTFDPRACTKRLCWIREELLAGGLLLAPQDLPARMDLAHLLPTASVRRRS